MKLLFKQRFFSWLDSYDIFYEDGSKAYTVEGKLYWGHRLCIYDASGNEVGMLCEVFFRGFRGLIFILKEIVSAVSERNFHFSGLSIRLTLSLGLSSAIFLSGIMKFRHLTGLSQRLKRNCGILPTHMQSTL